jgi:hypothetical protein
MTSSQFDLMTYNIDPQKTRVVCPVAACKAKWITLSNRSTHYGTHKNHDSYLPAYSDRLYREMTAENHDAFVAHWGVKLRNHPSYVAPCTLQNNTEPVQDAMQREGVSVADATLAMLSFLCVKQGTQPSAIISDFSHARNVATRGEQIVQNDVVDEVDHGMEPPSEEDVSQQEVSLPQRPKRRRAAPKDTASSKAKKARRN